MKTMTTMKMLAVAMALSPGVGQHAWADWTRSGSTITDANGWVLKVEARTINGVVGIGLPQDAVSTKGTPTGVLNLSGAISDGKTIVQIGDYAFRSSSAGTLYSVTLPNSVIRIGLNAFQNQTSLTNVTPLLPQSVKIVGARPFYNVPVRGALDMSSVTNMETGDSFFRGSSITSVVFGAGLKTLTAYAFENCKSLRSVRFANGLEKIADHAFSSCTNLYVMAPALPSTVKTVETLAFSGVPYGGSVEILNPAYTVVSYQFFGLSAKVSDYVLGTGVTNVADNAFDHYFNASAKYDIYFCGNVPRFGSSIMRSTSAFNARIFVPRGHDDWGAFIAANVVALTPAELNTYVADYPGEALPVGRWTPTSCNKQYLVTWVPPQDELRTTVIIVR